MMKNLQTTFLKPLTAITLGISLTACSQLKTQDDGSTDSLSSRSADHSLTPNSSIKPRMSSPQKTAENSPVDQQTEANERNNSVQATATIDFDHNDLWQVLSHNFRLTDQNQGKFDPFIDRYAKQTLHLETLSARAKPFLHYIFFEVNKRKMPLEIALLPMVESGFRSHAHSSSSASGLWQFMPSTANIYELKQDWWYDGRRDLISSTQAALDYLTRLNNIQEGDWLLALASYNAGMGTVARAKAAYRKQIGDPDAEVDFWKIQSYLPKETQDYVPKLLAYSYLIEHAENFGIQLEPIENKSFFNIVKLDNPTAIPLKKIAEVSDTPDELLALLNACYLRPLTPPKNSHHFLLPKENSHLLIEAMQKDPQLFNFAMQTHKVSRGETLSGIAQKYRLEKSVIKKFNRLGGNRLKAGQNLVLPIPRDFALPGNETFFADDNEFHRVKPGESLWLIAQHYNTSSHALAQMNGIRLNATIRSGQLLRVRAENPQQTQQTSVKRKVKQHHVVKGDSLWNLANLYKTNIAELRDLNNLKPNTILKLGQILKVPGENLDSIATAETPKKVHAALPETYEVKSGDSLWNLAKRFDTDVKSLLALNPQLGDGRKLRPGMELKVAKTQQKPTVQHYRVKKGDNLWSIAQGYKVSMQELAHKNNLSLNTPLSPGQLLYVPLAEATQSTF
ncbi:LysM peptidoglycan-binding domain-containing protein [Thiomicrorhabdus sp.]|uniref:LysM peptidoglycan-binding domain-containing protein n=1 Tax=Thiomicrorhabdus sp. TaxID=2039724 RepID=UPI0029C92DFE|nr:LysM peptidoglycan-binding domain-containing protein [Thiomicrorhabdus sp.]